MSLVGIQEDSTAGRRTAWCGGRGLQTVLVLQVKDSPSAGQMLKPMSCGFAAQRNLTSREHCKTSVDTKWFAMSGSL